MPLQNGKNFREYAEGGEIESALEQRNSYRSQNYTIESSKIELHIILLTRRIHESQKFSILGECHYLHCLSIVSYRLPY